MNSIEAAKIMIRDNKDDIESYRKEIQEYSNSIEQRKKEIAECERKLLRLRSDVQWFQELLKLCEEDKFKTLVDNLALNAFIADGGGLDMH